MVNKVNCSSTVQSLLKQLAHAKLGIIKDPIRQAHDNHRVGNKNKQLTYFDDKPHRRGTNFFTGKKLI